MFKYLYRVISSALNALLKQVNRPRRGNFVGELFYTIGAIAGILAVFAFIGFVFLIGPIALAYDVNHLVPLVTHKPADFHFYNPAIAVVGFFTTQIVVPVALFVWLAVTVGILS